MIQLDDVRDALALASGQLGLSIPVGALTDPTGPGFALKIDYTSPTNAAISGPVISHPTGVVGLGWALNVPWIEAVLPRGGALDRPRYRLFGPTGVAELVPLGNEPGGAERYGTATGEFWIVRYHRGAELWEITDEAGSVQRFGAAAGMRDAIDTIVGWSNWSGASTVARGQAAVAVRWRLASVTDRWGAVVVLSYDQDVGAVGVGRAALTRASRLAGVTGPRGGQIILTYGDKDPSEYQPAHTSPALPNAWQDAWDPKRLIQVATVAPGGATLATTRLDSSLMGTTPAVKRILTGVRQLPPAGTPPPGALFAYQTTTATDPDYGRIVAVTTPAGGVAQISWARVAPALSGRSTAITPPSGFPAPNLAVGEDVALALFRATDNSKVAARALVWEGRWIATDLLPSTALATTATITQTAIADASCAVQVGASLYPFMRDPRLAGAWTGASAPIPVALTAAEPSLLAATDGAAAVLGQTSLKLSAATFDGAAWNAVAAQTLTGAGTQPISALVGCPQRIVAAITDAADTNQGITLTLLSLDPGRNWNSNIVALSRPITAIDGVRLQLLPGYAVVRTTGPAGALRSVVFDLVDLTRPGGPVVTRLSQTLIDRQAELPDAALFAAGVTIGEQVWRYDGQVWNSASLNPVRPTGAGALQTLSPGADLVARSFAAASGTGVVSDVVTFDPNTAGWTSTLTATIATGSFAARAALAPGDDTGFALFPQAAGANGATSPGNALWRRQPDRSWRNCFTVPDAIAAADLGSLQIVGGRYLVYQAASAAVAYALDAQGVIAGSRTELAGAILLPATLGTSWFATYTGAVGPTATISLHRVTDTGADATASVPVIAKLRLLPGAVNDPTAGYPVIDHIPTYELASAIGDAGGEQAGFNRVALVQTAADGTTAGSVEHELFNGLTSAEATALPTVAQPAYPVDPASNAASYTRMLAGLSYRTTIAYSDPAGEARSDANSIAWNVVERTFVTMGAATGDPTGFYARVRTTANSRDGVAGTTAFIYNANGLPATAISSRYDGAGALETVTIAYSYLPDQYPAAPENLLAPVIRTTTSVASASVADEIETWQAWDTADHWGPAAQFVAATASAAAFTAWAGGATPAGWLKAEQVTARNATGAVTAATALGPGGVDLYDTSGERLVARFAAAVADEVGYLGFEPYETTADWSYLNSAIEAQVTTAQYHTGSRSLRIDPSNTASPAGPVAVFLNAATDRCYQFSCWMLTPAGFVADPTTASWTLQVSVAATGVAVGAPVVLGFPATAGKWAYLNAVVDLGAIRVADGIATGTVLSVTVLGADRRAISDASYADELRFSPLDGLFSAQVYELGTDYPVAVLGDNGATTRAVRSGTGAIVATIGPADNNVRMIAATGYAREMGGDAFNPAMPNQLVRCRSASFGIYHDFDPSDLNGWTLPSGWSMASNALQFAGQSSDPIGSRAELTAFAASDYAVRIRAPSAACQASSVSIGTGDLFVSWLPGQIPGQGSWSLRRITDTTPQVLATTPGSYREEWLFAIVDGVLLFFADGIQLFGWTLDFTPQGKLQLGATGAAAFAQLVVAVDPELSIEFSDGAGEALLGMALIDRQTVHVEGKLYDALGRIAVARSPVADAIVAATVPDLPAPAPTVIQGALTTYLPDKTGGTQMTLAEYLTPAISGAPYAQTLFEASPYARPIELGAPGSDYTVGSGHSTKLAYLANQADDWLTSVITDATAPGRAAGSYAITRVTDPNGLVVETAANCAGQVIARATRASAATAPIAIESFLYDPGGRQTEVRTPNYYAPPTDTAATVWRRTATYDFLGRQTGTSDPDSGRDLFASDSQGRPRFGLAPADAALTPPAIRYVRRDGLGRVIERGIVAKTGLAWANVATHVDDPSWPAAGDGAIWSHRYSYDRPVGAGIYDPQPANLVGRLAGLSVNSAGHASPAATDIETYTYDYDLSGNVTRYDVAVAAYDASVRRSTFDWDNLQRLIAITYPRPLDQSGQPQGAAVTVTYFYDRVGRIAGIGNAPEGTEVLDPSAPNPGPKVRFADYLYGPTGLPQQVTYGANSGGVITRSFSFDDGGRPTALSGDYFAQTLGYETGGLAGATDWAGRALTSQAQYSAVAGTDAAAITGDRTWQYRYDPRGWLNGAVASDAAVDASLTAGTAAQPITFDANGVIQAVPRGPVTESYGYVADGATIRANSAVRRITATAAQTVDFTAAALPDGWASGASNQGPSSSAIVTTGDPDAPFFQLSGGAPGHTEYLAFTAALGEQGSYTLAVRWRAVAPFAAQPGAAGVTLVLHTAAGDAYRAALADFAAGSASWRTDTVTVDVAAAVAASGLQGQVTAVAIELTNGKQGASGAAGAPLQVKSLVLAGGTTALAQISYDASGRVIAAPARGIATIGYGAAPGKPAMIDFATGAAVKQTAWRCEPNDRPVLQTTTFADNSVAKVLQLRAPGGGLLATETTAADGTITAAQFLHDEARVFGAVPSAGDAASYRLFDALGSLRVVATEGATGGSVAQYDYGPFGNPILANGGNAPRYAGHGTTAAGLIDLNARLYDPKLRALLTADRAQATDWAYGYAGGDPVNMVDPSGDIPLLLRRGLNDQPYRWGFYGVYVLGQAGLFIWSGALGEAWRNPAGILTDIAEIGVANVVGELVRYGSNPVVSPVQVLLTNAVHYPRWAPRWLPIMSLGLDIGSSLYWASTNGAVRTLSAYYVRGTLTQLDFAGFVNSTWHHGVSLSTVGNAVLSTTYRHFLAPRIWFPGDPRGIRGTGSRGSGHGPMIKATTGGNPLFLLADGSYAFEEYMTGSAYVPWFLQRGNMDMDYDTNFALRLARPFQYYWQGLRYNGAAYTEVLEHRTQPGWTLFMDHAVHTPGRGGTSHIGISAFIRNGAALNWWAWHSLSAGGTMLANIRYQNLAQLTGGGGNTTMID